MCICSGVLNTEELLESLSRHSFCRFESLSVHRLSLMAQIEKALQVNIMVAQTGTLANVLPFFMGSGSVKIEIGHYVGRNVSQYANAHLWPQIQHLHVLFFDLLDSDVEPPSPHRYHRWFSEHYRTAKIRLPPLRLSWKVDQALDLLRNYKGALSPC